MFFHIDMNNQYTDHAQILVISQCNTLNKKNLEVNVYLKLNLKSFAGESIHLYGISS